MAKKFIPQIRLTGRDFNQINNSLKEFAQRYYPETSKDLSENSSLALDIDLVSYVGDMLSFYLDYGINENFLDSAIEYKNVLRLAEQLGFKFEPFPSSTGPAALYIKVPAATDNTGPDLKYLGTLKKNSTFTSTAGTLFTLVEDCNFQDTNTQVVVAEVDSVTGVPTSYAIKSYGEIISGDLQVETIAVGSFQRYLKIPLGAGNITDVVSVVDSQGHEYVQVDYLSQDTVYTSIPNTNSDNTLVPAILKPVAVPRRFVVKREGVETFLQFGHGSDQNVNEDDYLDPSAVSIKQYGRNYIADTSFDPNKLLSGNSLGISPSDTTLTVTYRTNTTDNVNAPPGSVNTVTQAVFEFDSNEILNETKRRNVISSLEVENEKAITGDVTLPNIDELKIHALNAYPTQNRAVTREDYVSTVYRMPGKFGAIKRCDIVQDPDSFKRNLNLYVLAEDSQGNFAIAPNRLKVNLKNWLSGYKMMNDTIDILDGKIINLGIEYSILSSLDFDKFDVLAEAKRAIQKHLEKRPQMGEPFYLTDIYNVLRKVQGVVDVIDVKVTNNRTFGGSYSNYEYDVERNISADGRRLQIPSDTVWEVKFPNKDLYGEII